MKIYLKGMKMTIKELLKRLEIIRDSLSDTDSRWGIEGTMSDISELMSDIDNLGIKEKNETNR